MVQTAIATASSDENSNQTSIVLERWKKVLVEIRDLFKVNSLRTFSKEDLNMIEAGIRNIVVVIQRAGTNCDHCFKSKDELLEKLLDIIYNLYTALDILDIYENWGREPKYYRLLDVCRVDLEVAVSLW